MKLDGRSIISTYVRKMSVRPEFYSGRGATNSDLNSDILEDVYKGVKKEWGDEAATCFVQFVADMKVLSATGFLNDFYYVFVANQCKWTKRDTPPNDGIDVGPDNGGREAVGFATIAHVMSGSNLRDETEYIRSDFLRKHKGEYEGELPGVRNGVYFGWR